MIDIHTHILPGIDDGSANIRDSIEMARMAYKSGVNTLVVTPHCNIENVFDNYYNQELIDNLHSFQQKLYEEHLPLKVLLGMEVYATEEVPDLLCRGRLTTINQSRYLLIEFDFRYDPLLIEFLMKELTNLGFVLIIAHPERYPFIQKKIEILYHWIEQGCLIQINKGSIVGSFGFEARRVAIFLLDSYLATFVASDAHSPLQRNTDFSRVYQYLISNYTLSYVKALLEDNPRCVIENQDIILTHEINAIKGTNYNFLTKRG